VDCGFSLYSLPNLTEKVPNAAGNNKSCCLSMYICVYVYVCVSLCVALYVEHLLAFNYIYLAAKLWLRLWRFLFLPCALCFYTLYFQRQQLYRHFFGVKFVKLPAYKHFVKFEMLSWLFLTERSSLSWLLLSKSKM